MCRSLESSLLVGTPCDLKVSNYQFILPFTTPGHTGPTFERSTCNNGGSSRWGWPCAENEFSQRSRLTEQGRSVHATTSKYFANALTLAWWVQGSTAHQMKLVSEVASAINSGSLCHSYYCYACVRVEKGLQQLGQRNVCHADRVRARWRTWWEIGAPALLI